MNLILDVNVTTIINNLKIIKSKNKDKKICIPIKGNAYGLGYNIVDRLVAFGYDFFGVSTIEEALYIRKKHKDVDIILFSAIFKEDLKTVKDNDIIITIYDLSILELLDQNIRFHIKFDVGMGRLGFLKKDIESIKQILSNNNILPEGIYTHLPQAANEQVSLEQISDFENILKQFSEYEIKYIHYANGLASLKYSTNFDNLIRPGLIAYGYFENKNIQESLGLDIKPSTKLKVRCSFIKEYQGPVGYDSIDHIDGKLLTVPIGYHDGLRQEFRGYEIPEVGKIVGKICMDQTMILLDKDSSLEKGDYIYFFKLEELYDLSEYSKVSIYEILSLLGDRITRVYTY